MNDLLIAVACPLCLLVGLFAGAWLTHRAANRITPIPNVASALKSVMEVVFRRKAIPPVNNKFPRMRA